MRNLLADDSTVIERLLDHIDRKTTDLSEGVWREPVENYTSRERFAAEIASVFHRTPTPFCPSAALPEAGSYVARDASLTPIIAVRGQDGQVRAFRNACRHRGVRLAEGTGCRNAFTCRYHAWTYGLDGALRGVPHEYGFPGLDKSAHGLVPLATTEKHGMVFVTQEAGGADNEDDVIPDYFGPGWRLVSMSEQDFDFNWKIFVDGLLEGYHIRSTHAETFYPRQYDNVTVVETFGRNCRVSYPYRTIEKLRDVPPAERRARGALTQLNLLFPNVAVATFPSHMTMAVLEPRAVERTRLVTYTLSDRAESDMTVKIGQDFVTAGTAEDREMASATQHGLRSGANDVLTFGLFEGANRHFHCGLAEALGET
ncbi:aromatic ring-hydroxylating dioxygenase subunit alpha [Parvibaculum sp.]|uniref:aromatic ring-hydroxylating dioxygenase subunit alpha n=1 Tax=Parvibaculum sp. TaxID=2024848 RepID=UPI00349FFC76